MLFRTPFSFPPSAAPSFRSPSSPSSRPTLAGAALFALLGLGIAAPTFVATGCASPSGLVASRNAQGVELYATGDYDRAIAVFQETLAENPENAETLYNLGAAYQRKALATGDYALLTQAENAYWAALEREAAPETIVCCYRGLATSASTRGDAATALQTLEDWRDRNPDSIEPKLEIAYFLEAQERDDEAYAVLEEVAAAAPNDYRAFYKMGVLQERAGNVQEALDKTTIAGRLNPTDAALAKKATELRAALEQNAAKATETADESPISKAKRLSSRRPPRPTTPPTANWKTTRRRSRRRPSSTTRRKPTPPRPTLPEPRRRTFRKRSTPTKSSSSPAPRSTKRSPKTRRARKRRRKPRRPPRPPAAKLSTKETSNGSRRPPPRPKSPPTPPTRPLQPIKTAKPAPTPRRASPTVPATRPPSRKTNKTRKTNKRRKSRKTRNLRKLRKSRKRRRRPNASKNEPN